MWLRPHPAATHKDLEGHCISMYGGTSQAQARSHRRSQTGINAAAAALAASTAATSVSGSQRPSDKGGEHGGGSDRHGPLLLLSCGGDGMIRVWHIASTGKLVCTLPGAQGKLEQVGKEWLWAYVRLVVVVFKLRWMDGCHGGRIAGMVPDPCAFGQ